MSAELVKEILAKAELLSQEEQQQVIATLAEKTKKKT